MDDPESWKKRLQALRKELEELQSVKKEVRNKNDSILANKSILRTTAQIAILERIIRGETEPEVEMSRPNRNPVARADYHRPPMVSMIIMHDDPYRITISHKDDLNDVQWTAFTSTPDAPEPDPVRITAGMLLDIEGTPLQNKAAAPFGKMLSANCSNNAYLKIVNKKPYYEITDHDGKTIALKDVILQPDFNTHLARSKHALELAKQMEERFKAVREEILIKLKAWREIRFYEEANLLLRLWDTNRRHCLQSALTPHHVEELRVAVAERSYDDDKHVQRLTDKTYTDPWFSGILSKGNTIYIPAQHRWRNGPVHIAVQDRIAVARSMQAALSDEIQEQMRNMKEAVDQAQREERENRRRLRAARKRSLDDDGLLVQRQAEAPQPPENTAAIHLDDWKTVPPHILLQFLKERYSIWGLPGINVQDALGLGTFAQYKEGSKEFDYTIVTSLRPELSNTLGAEEIKAGMPWGTPFAALNDACNNRPAYAFEAMMEIDARRALMRLEEWFVKLDPTTRGDCRRTKLEEWKLPALLAAEIDTIYAIMD